MNTKEKTKLIIETDRQTDRQTDRYIQTDRQTDRQIQTHRHTVTDREKERGRER